MLSLLFGEGIMTFDVDREHALRGTFDMGAVCRDQVVDLALGRAGDCSL